MRIVQRLMSTSAGRVYFEADYDGVRGTRFDVTGLPSQWFELHEPFERSFRDELELADDESGRLAHELRDALTQEDESEEPFGWGAVAFLIGFVGIWIFGFAVIVYLVVRAIL